MRLSLPFTLILLLASGATAQVPIPGQGSTGTRVAPRTSRAPNFEFRSNFWLNLHHFLYHQARLRPGATSPGGTPSLSGLARNVQPVNVAEMTADEQKAWNEALDYYAANLSGRDLLFNGDMVNIKNRLVEWEKQPDVNLSGLRAELIAALTKAAPIYRARWWSEHDGANRTWIAAIEPRIAAMGERISSRQSRDTTTQ